VKRDARPFVAFYLRARADERLTTNGMALHALARWVENLPGGDEAMRRIEATNALDYEHGDLRVGAATVRIVDEFREDSPGGYESFLSAFAAAVERDTAS
jgi:hypothetical protein